MVRGTKRRMIGRERGSEHGPIVNIVGIWQKRGKSRNNSAGEIMENIEGDLEMEPFVSAVRDGIHSALGSDLIGDEDCEKIVNAISLTHCNITWEDIDQVSHLYFCYDTAQGLQLCFFFFFHVSPFPPHVTCRPRA